jgi:hypothetical protein
MCVTKIASPLTVVRLTRKLWGYSNHASRTLPIFTIRDIPGCLFGLVASVPDYSSRGSEFDSRGCQISCEIVGLERVPLSPLRITEELLGRNSSGSGLETRD